MKAMGVKGLEAREVQKAKMVNGELIGRLRWTPKGFQESDPAAWEHAVGHGYDAVAGGRCQSFGSGHCL